MREESVFQTQWPRPSSRIETALEECGADMDVEPKQGCVLESEFDNGSQ